jgi:hypothetical protein
LCRHTAKVGHFERGVSEDDSERLHPLMGHLEELLEQPEFPEYLKSGRVYSIASKIAEKVLVLFKYRYIDALASQQVSEHHACRPAAHNTATCFHDLR